ncbi:acetate--CoA ligase family protein [Pseudooceanicola nitratireducens]|uniref:acetate--CoA ligase family protein n=1 Tax=Pseudooceanicola nitratireducens TaxID=517719 RepID=UPI001C98D2F4|nr:acetate--CoA ligase family protein [Pseudooceanicola nitratireducens]MBY6156609.1 acetate--CoA ligase family protein [Pseudooceanicola nitratireducens]
MTRTLSALLAPSSLALVGASDDATRIGGRPLRYLREAGFTGRIYPVNPKRDSVQGLPAFADIAALPEVPDTAILALPASATLSAVQACADGGVPTATIFSAGFAEMGDEGRALQSRILATAREAGLRLLGPNCLGVFNPAAQYYGTFSVILDGQLMQPGPVGVVSQSGAYGSHLAHLARKRGLGISKWVTTGNEADIDLSEALSWLVEDPQTRVIMAYAEGVQDRDRFIAALEAARQAGKPVVFMKTGRSSVGAEAAASHTAALAGSDAVFDAVLRQYGAYRAATTAEQIDVAYACARSIDSAGGLPSGNRIGIFTMSGGFGIQLADDSEAAGLDVSPMPEPAQAELLKALPFAAPRNPVDATAQAVTDMGLLTQSVRAMLEQGGYDIFTAILGTGPGSPTFSAKLRAALQAAQPDQGSPILRALTMSAPDDAVRAYEDDGFLVYEDGSALANALGALVTFSAAFARPATDPAALSMDQQDLPDGPVSEAGAKRLLACAGIPFPPEHLVTDAAGAAQAARDLGGPVVIKIASPDILHKTEVGGVAVNIPADQAEARAARMLADIAQAVPKARIEGLLVAPMAPEGVETIIGVSRDPVLGPVVMFGLGGVFVEVLRDVTFRAAPFDRAEAHRMIRDIRGYPMLEGVRGAGRADIEALAQLLSDLSRFAFAHRDQVAGIDLNPVRVLPEGQGVLALDALIDFGKDTA